MLYRTPSASGKPRGDNVTGLHFFCTKDHNAPESIQDLCPVAKRMKVFSWASISFTWLEKLL